MNNPYWIAKCWVHPESGGDDYTITIELGKCSKPIARKNVVAVLKRKGSCVLDDYFLYRANEMKVTQK
jgi:hypothetical protein